MRGGDMRQFYVRDVLWLTMAVAFAVGWRLEWLKSSTIRAEHHQLVKKIALYAEAGRNTANEAAIWRESAKSQRARADFVSDQLYDRQNLHTFCPKCGTSVKFPEMKGKPWTPPEGSLWPDAPKPASLIVEPAGIILNHLGPDPASPLE